MELLAAILVFLVSYRVMLTFDFNRDNDSEVERERNIRNLNALNPIALLLCLSKQSFILVYL